MPGRNRERIAEHHRRRFDRLLRRALRRLPPTIWQYLDNVGILTADAPTAQQRAVAGTGPDDDLLGLYEGVPIPHRTSYTMVLPDRITLFRRALEARFRDDDALEEEIRRTLIHEIAHHRGFEEGELPF
jgi:predicted Zn-dependent protease with MMP-like domain